MLSKEIISGILEARGIPQSEHEHFLHPDFERDIHSPERLPDIEKAVARLVAAKNQKIIIFGDYDADGVPATALLLRVLKGLGFSDVEGMIPTREQGYGLTPEIVGIIASKNPHIVIAVDNGTIAHEEVAALAALSIDVIIIDHHEPLEGKIADTALAIVNPKMPGSTYPFPELCACALAWKVAVALSQKLGEDTAQLKWELDLVALSTIADMVPMVGENRVLASYGLKVLAKTRNKGLKALMLVAGLKDQITAGDVGFKLAPRINAPSRMHNELLGTEHVSLALLTTDESATAESLAIELNQRNSERQQLVDAHLGEAHAQVGPEDLVIIAYHKQWSTGVIGLVASKLVERYKRPAVVLAPEGDSIKGSVRSTEGVHALELLEAGTSELERFGGHIKAAGLTLNGSIEKFRAALSEHMALLGLTLESLASAQEKIPDAIIAVDDISLELAEDIEKLAPFGIGFPTPLFEVKASVCNVRRVGAEGKHVSFFLSDGDIQKKAIAFSYYGPELIEGEEYLFYGNVEKEEWREVVSPVFHVRRVVKQ